MKRIQTVATMWGIILLLTFSQTSQAQTYDKLWKQVEQAQQNGRPQTIIALTSLIAQRAYQEQNASQLLKATICRNAYQEQLTPDSLCTHIKQLEQWVTHENKPVNSAILHSLLAEKYVSFVTQNLRSLLTRNELETEKPPTDIREWSKQQFVYQIDEHLQASLQPMERLRETSSEAYIPFVIQEKGSRVYRHSMYHLLADRAIKIYAVLTALSADSLKNNRVDAIYTAQCNYYRSCAGMEEAYILCSLDYQAWKRNFELHSLDTLITQYSDHDVCAEVYLKKAQILYNRGNKYQALQVCEEGIKRYASYQRVRALKNLRTEILSPTLSMRAWDNIYPYPGKTQHIRLTFSHLSGVTLRLYQTTLDPPLSPHYEITEQTLKQKARLCASYYFALHPTVKKDKPLQEWPYIESDTLLSLPMPSTPGLYILQAIPDGKSNISEAIVLPVTHFSALTQKMGDGTEEIMVLDAATGHPVPEAKVKLYDRSEKELFSLQCSMKGKAQLPYHKEVAYYAVCKGQDRAFPLNYYRMYVDSRQRLEESKKELTLLTDRSLYRPGQTVYVKGVAYEQYVDSAKVLSETDYYLTFLDVNHKKIAAQEVRTNEFGSFFAKFVLPDNCLNGNYRIKCGEISRTIRVEEYKRPSFEIVLNPLTEAYRLGDKVMQNGYVKAFNGTSVRHVAVSYTLLRNTPNIRFNSEPLLADTVYTDEEGRFSIPLKFAVASEEKGRTHTFEWEVSVTNEIGETQTAKASTAVSQYATAIQENLPEILCKEHPLCFTFTISNGQHTMLKEKGGYCLEKLPYQGILDTDSTLMCLHQEEFMSGEALDCTSWSTLPSGDYRLTYWSGDRENADSPLVSRVITLFSETDNSLQRFTDLFFFTEQKEFDEENPVSLFVGSSHKDAYLLFDLFQAGRRIESKSILLSDTLMHLTLPYKKTYGNAISLYVTLVKNGQCYIRSLNLSKSLPDYRLRWKWNVFRDYLYPGQKETWSLTIHTPQGTPADAEMLALMYDASLDKIWKHSQRLAPSFIPSFLGYARHMHNVGLKYVHFMFPRKLLRVPHRTFDRFYSPYAVTENAVSTDASAIYIKGTPTYAADFRMTKMADSNGVIAAERVGTETSENQELLQSELSSLRTDFSETAFFIPQLCTNRQGEIVLTFTMPDTQTRWNFRGYAHTKQMQTGSMEEEVVTAKDFMVTPDVPRFFRSGDQVQLKATITNLTAGKVKGKVVLQLFEPQTEKILLSRNSAFSTEGGKNETVDFVFRIPDKTDLVGLRIVADGGHFSDGEQHLLPILSNKEWITETKAVTLRGNLSRVCLDSLFNHNASTATHRRLTVEVSDNPLWSAIQVLPVLNNPTTDNALAWASAYYGNVLSNHVVVSSPKVFQAIKSWGQQKGETQGGFFTQLMKNQELKNILLNETPWIVEVQTEAEQRARLASLLDSDNRDSQTLLTWSKLKALQNADGSWSWYKGMQGNRYITTYILEQLLRLQVLTGKTLVGEEAEVKQRAFGYLNKQVLNDYRALKKVEKQGRHTGPLPDNALKYLYLCALDGGEIDPSVRQLHKYFLSYLGNDLATASLQRKICVAFVLWKIGRKAEALRYVRSVEEHLVQSEERGAYFAFNETPYAWGMHPIPTHVSAMELFQLVGGHESLLEEMKVWLLQQKRTVTWVSPVATADALYALFLCGDKEPEVTKPVYVSLGYTTLNTVENSSLAPLTGYLKKSFEENHPALKSSLITFKKQDETMAWGTVYAQYFSPMVDVKQQGDELNIKKQLFVERITNDGKKTLQPLSEDVALRVGDKLVTRLVIRLDRAMDFIQLKDSRAACLEPQISLSGYCYTNGMGYYAEVDDAVTNFFFDHLGKGTYVLEHTYRVVRAGTYTYGAATIQSAYAPEYASHSAGGSLSVQSSK